MSCIGGEWDLGAHCSDFSFLGGLCPMFSRLFPPARRDTQWTVSPGQLGQTPTGDLGRCGGEDVWLADWHVQGSEAGFMGVKQA